MDLASCIYPPIMGSWDLDAVLQMAVVVDDDIVTMLLFGIFGWTGMSEFFNCHTKSKAEC
jgi:hypothetical protein